jgi:hypothetical protein
MTITVVNFGNDTYLISDSTETFDRIGLNEEKAQTQVLHLTTLANLNEESVTKHIKNNSRF